MISTIELETQDIGLIPHASHIDLSFASFPGFTAQHSCLLGSDFPTYKKSNTGQWSLGTCLSRLWRKNIMCARFGCNVAIFGKRNFTNRPINSIMSPIIAQL